jgi:hypothetical protein
MADWFNKNTEVKGHYLPAGVYHEEARLEEKSQKINDILFVGSKGYHPEYPYRTQLIDWLKGTYGDKFRHIGGDGEGVIRGMELTDLYNQTKIVVGDSLVKNFDYPYYWSDRLYETIGRGGFIIFPYIVGLEDEFVLNTDDLTNNLIGHVGLKKPVELVTYRFGDFEHLKYLIDYYLENNEEREAILKRGFEKVKNNYTYKHRWETILKEVGLT